MFCRHCGAEIENGSTFCSKCGKSVTEEHVKAEVVSNSSSNNKNDEMNICALLGFIFSIIGGTIVALVLSIIGRNQIKKQGGKGEGFAIAGMIISIVEIALAVIAVIVYAIIIVAAVNQGQQAQPVNI